MTVRTTLHSARLRVEVSSLLHADAMRERHQLVAYERGNDDAPVGSLELHRRTVKAIEINDSARGRGLDMELLGLAEGWLGRPLVGMTDHAIMARQRATKAAGC